MFADSDDDFTIPPSDQRSFGVPPPPPRPKNAEPAKLKPLQLQLQSTKSIEELTSVLQAIVTANSTQYRTEETRSIFAQKLQDLVLINNKKNDEAATASPTPSPSSFTPLTNEGVIQFADFILWFIPQSQAQPQEHSVGQKILAKCDEVIDLVANHLLPQANTSEAIYSVCRSVARLTFHNDHTRRLLGATPTLKNILDILEHRADTPLSVHWAASALSNLASSGGVHGGNKAVGLFGTNNRTATHDDPKVFLASKETAKVLLKTLEHKATSPDSIIWVLGAIRNICLFNPKNPFPMYCTSQIGSSSSSTRKSSSSPTSRSLDIIAGSYKYAITDESRKNIDELISIFARLAGEDKSHPNLTFQGVLQTFERSREFIFGSTNFTQNENVSSLHSSIYSNQQLDVLKTKNARELALLLFSDSKKNGSSSTLFAPNNRNGGLQNFRTFNLLLEKLDQFVSHMDNNDLTTDDKQNNSEEFVFKCFSWLSHVIQPAGMPMLFAASTSAPPEKMLDLITVFLGRVTISVMDAIRSPIRKETNNNEKKKDVNVDKKKNKNKKKPKNVFDSDSDDFEDENLFGSSSGSGSSKSMMSGSGSDDDDESLYEDDEISIDLEDEDAWKVSPKRVSSTQRHLSRWESVLRILKNFLQVACSTHSATSSLNTTWGGSFGHNNNNSAMPGNKNFAHLLKTKIIPLGLVKILVDGLKFIVEEINRMTENFAEAFVIERHEQQQQGEKIITTDFRALYSNQKPIYTRLQELLAVCIFPVFVELAQFEYVSKFLCSSSDDDGSTATNSTSTDFVSTLIEMRNMSCSRLIPDEEKENNKSTNHQDPNRNDDDDDESSKSQQVSSDDNDVESIDTADRIIEEEEEESELTRKIAIINSIDQQLQSLGRSSVSFILRMIEKNSTVAQTSIVQDTFLFNPKIHMMKRK